MISKLHRLVIILQILFQSAVGSFEASGSSNLVVYWGQASAGSQERLSSYCTDDVDMVILSFMTAFPGTNGVPQLNFANACWEQYSNGLLHCTNIAKDIKTCQQKGIKVLLSLGGASGAYGFQSDSDATKFADTLWDLFGEGKSDTRPFDDAVVDGFDLDIEDNNPHGYAALVRRLRSRFKDSSKDYYISAAPQCPIPDASLNDVLTKADVDYAFIQFYNNYCSIGANFNFDDWITWAQNDAFNKDIKLYLGLPGSRTAAGSGYVSTDTVESTVKQIACSSYFGGVSVWDASQSFLNKENGQSWASLVRKILDNGDCSSGLSSSISQTFSLSSTASSLSSSISQTSSLSSSISQTSSLSSSISQTYSLLSPVSSLSSTTSQTSNLSSPTSQTSSLSSTTSQTSNLSSPSSQASSLSPPSSQTSTLIPLNSIPKPEPPSSSVATSALTNPPTSFSIVTLTFQSLITSLSSVKTTINGNPTTIQTTLTLHSDVPVIQPGSSGYDLTSVPSQSTFKTSTTTKSSDPNNPSNTPVATPSDCSKYSGLQKARCMNSNYGSDSYYAYDTSCTDGTIICRGSGALAICDHGSWVTFQCAPGTSCYAYTSAGSDDVSVSCNFAHQKSIFT